MQFDEFIEKKYSSYSYSFKTDFANVIKNNPILTDDQNKQLMSKILKGRTRSLLINNPDILSSITERNLIPIKTVDRILDIYVECDDYTKRNFKYSFVDNLIKNNYKFSEAQIQKLIQLGVSPTKFFDKDYKVSYDDFLSFLQSKDYTFDGIKLFLEKYNINILNTKCLEILINTKLTFLESNIANILSTFTKFGMKLDDYKIVFSKLHVLIEKPVLLNSLYKYIKDTNKIQLNRSDVDFLVNNYGYSNYLEKDYFKGRYVYTYTYRDILLKFVINIFNEFMKLKIFTIDDFNKFIFTNKVYPDKPPDDYDIFITNYIIKKGDLKINKETIHNGFYYGDNTLINNLAEANMLGEYLTEETFKMSCLNTNYRFINYHLQCKFEPTIEHAKLLIYQENSELKTEIVKCIESLVSYGLLINDEVARILRAKNIDPSCYSGNTILFNMINDNKIDINDKNFKKKYNEKVTHLIDKKVDPEIIIKCADENNVNIKTEEYLNYTILVNNFRFAWYFKDKLNMKPSLEFIMNIDSKSDRKFYSNLFY